MGRGEGRTPPGSQSRTQQLSGGSIPRRVGGQAHRGAHAPPRSRRRAPLLQHCERECWRPARDARLRRAGAAGADDRITTASRCGSRRLAVLVRCCPESSRASVSLGIGETLGCRASRSEYRSHAPDDQCRRSPSGWQRSARGACRPATNSSIGVRVSRLGEGCPRHVDAHDPRLLAGVYALTPSGSFSSSGGSPTARSAGTPRRARRLGRRRQRAEPVAGEEEP